MPNYDVISYIKFIFFFVKVDQFKLQFDVIEVVIEHQFYDDI